MAQIHVTKKETNIWMWVIPILMVAVVAWWMFGRDDRVGTRTGTLDSTSVNRDSVRP